MATTIATLHEKLYNRHAPVLFLRLFILKFG